MKVAIVLLAVVLGCHALSTEQVQNEWAKFETKFGKTYKSPVEMRKRMSIFADNLEKIDAHNALYEQGLETFKMGVTQFTDLTEDEFMTKISSFVNPDDNLRPVGIFQASNDSDAPESIDWREKGKVSKVKDQGGCGSCWSFSATGAMESLIRIEYNRSLDLSEQNLVDCAVEPKYYCYGCSGGQMTTAFQYVIDNGIESEAEYPYQEEDSSCKQKRKVFQLKGYVQVSADEESLRQAVGTVGPVSIGIAAGTSFQNYAGGIIDGGCAPSINHGVLAVGYGNENGQDYWVIKNSWGASWGEEGFIRVSRNKNTCNLTLMSSYPTLK